MPIIKNPVYTVCHSKMEEPYYKGDSLQEATEVFEKQKNYWKSQANVEVTEIDERFLTTTLLRSIRLEHGPRISLYANYFSERK